MVASISQDALAESQRVMWRARGVLLTCVTEVSPTGLYEDGFGMVLKHKTCEKAQALTYFVDHYTNCTDKTFPLVCPVLSLSSLYSYLYCPLYTAVSYYHQYVQVLCILYVPFMSFASLRIGDTFLCRPVNSNSNKSPQAQSLDSSLADPSSPVRLPSTKTPSNHH